MGQFSRVNATVLELDIDTCLNIYGAAPCTAGRVHSGTAQAGTSTSLTLAAGASAVDDAYNNHAALAVSGAGSAQERNITDYIGATKVAAISPRWSTNMLSYPSQFDNAVWTKANATITPNVIAASDGTLTADKLVENTSNSVHDVSRLNISGSVDGDTAIVVAEVKKAERIGVQLYCQRRDTTPSWNVTFFNFDTQTFTGTTAGCTVDVQTLPDGWYRIWLRGPLNSGTSVPDWGLRLISVWPFTTTYVGDGTSGAYVARAQIEFNQDIGDFIDGGANPVTLPDATTVYDIIDRPNACYHTYKSCQDKAAYNKGTQTLKFTDRGAPFPAGEALRPYLSAIKFAPTEIDQDAGIAKRASVALTAADEPDSDIQTDPYVATRATAAQGTFWARFFARNHNYSGRPARIKRAYLTGAWSWGDFVTELYQIEAMKGPSGRGEANITLKDPLKIVDRVKLPAPSSGKLALALATSDLRMVLGLGDGSQYTDAGTVRIGDQIIRYTRKEVENGWNFTNNTLDGFSATNADLASGTDTLTVTASAADPQIRVVSSIYGYRYRYLLARLKRNVAGAWKGRCYYSTGSHGESASYYKDISEPAGIGSGYVTAVWDMHALTAGGTDWQINTIIGVRLDLDANSGSVYEIDWIGWSETATLDRNVLTLPDSTYRSQFGTTAALQKIGDGVQQCLDYVNQPFSTVVQNLLNQAGIVDANIDLAGLQAEDSTWLGSRYHISACLSEPEDVGVYLGELAVQSGGCIWWAPVAQKVKYKFLGPSSPAAVTNNVLTDEAHIVDGSMQVEPLDNLRKTYAAVYYELYSATANRKEAKNYTRGEIYIDAGAESANEYNDRRVDVTYSRWFTNANSAAMAAWAKRRIGYYRDVPKKLDFKIDPKDAVVAEGDLYDITTDALTGFDGAPQTVRCLITKRQDNAGDIGITARTTNFGRRYGFIAPNGTSNYPNNNGYACACNSAGFMNDGTSGYLII
jgi:hypothetical protein